MAQHHGRRISVIGLGYVGLPVAVEFGRQLRTIGFDIDSERIVQLREGYDRTNEISREELLKTNIWFSSKVDDLVHADFHIVAVPTPIDSSKRPNLEPLLHASHSLGQQLKTNDIVVFESTVYPGVTEEKCIPALEIASGLKCGVDFFVGYSPERMNPGDRNHNFSNTIKIVSAQDPITTAIIADVYRSVVVAGVHITSSIKVAEAAKVIENTQRDINIALMNELAILFDIMNIDTKEVLEAAETKWNFLTFTPGLVGGHCIGVDPYYLTHKAAVLDYIPQIILAGRHINDSMAEFVASRTIKALINQQIAIHEAKITVLGLSFKENVSDIRNSKSVDVVKKLREYGVNVQTHDPLADPAEALKIYNIHVTDIKDLSPANAVIFAVAHKEYADQGWELIRSLLNGGRGVVIDIKSILPRSSIPSGISLWRL